MPDRFGGRIIYKASIEGLSKSLDETKAEIRKAKLEATITGDTKKLLADYEAAKTAIERSRITADVDSSGLETMRQAVRNTTRDRLAGVDAVRKAEFAAYRENDARGRKAIRDNLKALKAQNLEMSRVLGSGQRPQRSALLGSSKAFADRSDEVVAKYNLDLSPAEKEAQAFRVRLLALRLEFKPGMDTAKINRQIVELDAELAHFQDRRDIPVELQAETRVARSQLEGVIHQVREDGLRGVRLRLISEGNLTKIRAEVDKLRIILAQPLRARVVINDNIDKVKAKLRALQAQTALTGGGLSRFQKILLGVVLAAGPAAIALGGVATAIGAIGTAAVKAVGSLGVLPGLIATAGGAFAALKVGYSGVSDALKAYTTQQTALSVATRKTLAEQNALRNASEAVKDAQLDQVAQQRQATESINALLDQRIDLQKQLADSNLSIRSAEADRAKTLTTLSRAIRDVNAANRQAALDVQDAQDALTKASLEGDQRAIDRAKADLEAAKTRQSDTADDGKTTIDTASLVKEQADAEVAAAYAAQASLTKQLQKLDTDLAQTRDDNARQAEQASRRLRDAREAEIDAQTAATEATKTQATATNALNAAMAKLAPNARLYAAAVNASRDAWDGVTRSVQQALFTNAAAGFELLTRNYVPLLNVGLTGIATALNGLGSQANGFFNSAGGLDIMQSILANVRDTLVALQPAVQPFLQALTTILDVSTAQLPGLVGQFTDLLNRFNTFISAAAADGSFARWINDGVHNLSLIIQLVYELGTAFSSIVSAMNQGGGIQGMVDVLRDFNAAIGEGGASRQGLVDFFKNLSSATETVFTPALAKNLGDIFSAFGANLVTIAPQLRDFLQSFTGFIAKVTESGALPSILNGLLGALTSVFDALARPEVISAISQIAAAFGDLLVAVGPVLGEAIAAIAPPLASLITSLVELLVPALGGIADFIAAHPDLFGNLVVGAGALLLAATKLGPILLTVAGWLGELGAFILPLISGEGGLAALGAVFAPVIAALGEVLIPVILVVAAIAALAFGIYELVKHWDDVKRFFSDIGSAIADAAKAVWAKGGEIIQFAKDLPGKLADAGRNLWGWIGDRATDAYNAVLGFGQQIVDFITGLPATLASAGRDILIWIGSKMLEAVLGAIVIGVRLVQWVMDLPAKLAEAGRDMFVWLVNRANDAYQGAVAFGLNLVAFVVSLPGRLQEAGLQIFAWLVNRANDAYNGAVQFGINLVSFIVGLPGRLQEAGRDMFVWLVNRANDAYQGAVTFGLNLVAFVAGLPGRLQQAGLQLFAWIVTKANDAYQGAVNFGANLVSFVTGLPGRIAQAAKSLWNPIADGFKSMVNSVIRLWNNLELPLTVPEDKFSKALGISGAGITLKTPDIPYLAKGGEVTSATIAMIGEAGRERVTPLDDDGLSKGERRVLSAVENSMGAAPQVNVKIVAQTDELLPSLKLIQDLLGGNKTAADIHDVLSSLGRLDPASRKKLGDVFGLTGATA